MAATIKIKNSSTASAVPTSSDLVQGELAVNVTDKRIFTENASGTVVELGTNPSILTLPDGSASAPTLTNDGDTNTGIFFPAADTVGITTGGTERARVDSSGNLGLGVTPSAWGSGLKALQINSRGVFFGSANNTFVANNYYDDGSSYRYIASAAATDYYQASGQHVWRTAASGTAGNAITFTQAMTLDASGNLLVGTTSATYGTSGRGVIEVNGSSTSLMALKTGGSAAGYMYHDGTNMYVVNTKAAALAFSTDGTERARIDSSGNLLVGTTSTINVFSGTQDGGVIESTGVFVASKNNNSPMYLRRRGTDGTIISFNKDTTAVGTISVTASATAYNTSSDYRLKDIIGPVTGVEAKDFIMSLQPKKGTWKVDGSKFVGFLAHEFQEVSPTSVTGTKDAIDADGNPVMQAMQASSSEVMANLIAHIQNLETRLAALEQV